MIYYCSCFGRKDYKVPKHQTVDLMHYSLWSCHAMYRVIVSLFTFITHWPGLTQGLNICWANSKLYWPKLEFNLKYSEASLIQIIHLIRHLFGNQLWLLHRKWLTYWISSYLDSRLVNRGVWISEGPLYTEKK